MTTHALREVHKKRLSARLPSRGPYSRAFLCSGSGCHLTLNIESRSSQLIYAATVQRLAA